MKRNMITVAIAVSMITGLCFANEIEVGKSKNFSIRASLGTSPGTDEFEVDGGTGAQSLDADSGARLEILAVERFLGSNDTTAGLMLGGGIFSAGHSGKNSTEDDVETSAFGFIAQCGLAVKAGEGVVVEFGPYLGIGLAENELEGFSDGDGPYALFGLKGSAFVSLGENVELGLEVGYEGWATQQEVEIDGSNYDVTFSGKGARVAGVLAVKF